MGSDHIKSARPCLQLNPSPLALKQSGKVAPTVHYSYDLNCMSRTVVGVGPCLVKYDIGRFDQHPGGTEYLRVTLALTRMLDEHFRLATKIGKVSLRAERVFATYLNVNFLNVSTRLRRPQKLSGHEERETLLPGELPQALHQNPLRRQVRSLCLLPTSHVA